MRLSSFREEFTSEFIESHRVLLHSPSFKGLALTRTQFENVDLLPKLSLKSRYALWYIGSKSVAYFRICGSKIAKIIIVQRTRALIKNEQEFIGFLRFSHCEIYRAGFGYPL